ncbi:MAG: flavin reductase [Clostridia bacterium]|nr:flavin reductase [Clostridia bacterium]
MDNKALFNITYGLYLLTTKDEHKDNGCIVNTVTQVAESPVRISVSVSKRNLTCEMIEKSGEFNVSAITSLASFDLFRHFGMQSGREADKFDGFNGVKRSANGIYYLTETSNMYLSAKVLNSYDLGTHMLFIAEVTEGEVLSPYSTCTYGEYQREIKPAPKKVEAEPKKDEPKKWICTVCGYVYEGDEVPDDYLCPLCNHGKDVFEEMK